jgi:hypothetical protein
LSLLGVLALVAALAATALITKVFDGGSGRKGPDPGKVANSTPAGPPVIFPTSWPVRYSDSLQSQRGWSAAAFESENASCAFRNDRLEVDMLKGGIYRCPGQRDELTDFAFTIEVYLLDGLPCGGLWLRRGAHEDGRDAAYLVQICPNEMTLGHHHAAGDIVNFAGFPTPLIQHGQKVVVGVVARGDEISLFRDGKFVGKAQDSKYPHGRIALGIAVKIEVGAGHLAYRNVEMRWP